MKIEVIECKNGVLRVAKKQDIPDGLIADRSAFDHARKGWAWSYYHDVPVNLAAKTAQNYGLILEDAPKPLKMSHDIVGRIAESYYDFYARRKRKIDNGVFASRAIKAMTRQTK